MITQLAVSGYRSLRDLRLVLAPVTVVTGANGSGKSSLYRALRLLADIAQGGVIRSLASEGGLNSTLWAGPETLSRAMKAGEVPVQGTRRNGPVALRLGFASEDYGYAIDLGLPSSPMPAFPNDPVIKAESVWLGERLDRTSVIAERRGPLVRIRAESGAWQDVSRDLATFDSMMTHCADPVGGLELLVLRERMRGWRFYDHLRADREAPSRLPQIGTYTPVLASDGSDIAAAIQTIRAIGASEELDVTITDAFPGARLDVVTRDGFSEVIMQQHGLLRPLRAAELSEGTLRFVLLVAALLSPRPPDLMILNEPEISLHPDLLAPLARLVARAARSTQIILVSHAETLVQSLAAEAGAQEIRLSKQLGETGADGHDATGWNWPAR